MGTSARLRNSFSTLHHQYRYHRFQIRRRWHSLAIAAILLLGLWLCPASAQVNPLLPKESIVLDGEKLFELSDSEEFPAAERADWIEGELRTFAESPVEIDVRIEERNGLPTILINDRYLLTVTEQDASLEKRTPTQQALLWEKIIQKALVRAHQERDGEFLRETLLKTFSLAVVALLLSWGLGEVWRLYLKPDVADENSLQWMKVWRLTLAMARLLVFVAATLYITNLFPWTRQWSYKSLEILLDSLTEPLFTAGERTYSITNLLILLALLVGWVTLANKLTNQFRSRILPITGLKRNTGEIVTTVMKYLVIAIGTVVLLQLWGLDLSSLTILASALSVGIGFGFQDIAKNFGSGIVLMFERPIRAGDFVKVGEYTGTVERIGSRSTVIRTLDQISIIVPNSRFLESEVMNWSHDNPVSRLRIPIGVAYGSDIQVVKSILLDAAVNHSDVLKLPPPRVTFSGFGDSSLDFELWVWCNDPSRQYILKSDLYFEIEESFRKSQVEIPFPQRDLNLRTGSLPLEMSPKLEEMILKLLKQIDRG